VTVAVGLGVMVVVIVVAGVVVVVSVVTVVLTEVVGPMLSATHGTLTVISTPFEKRVMCS
jgi:hypothetical protein